jgi:hypothetical protein
MSTVWLVESLLSVATALVGLVGQATDPVPDPQDVKPGWIALITVASLCAASLLLWFSMRKQLRKIQVPREDEGTTDQVTTPDDQADAR